MRWTTVLFLTFMTVSGTSLEVRAQPPASEPPAQSKDEANGDLKLENRVTHLQARLDSGRARLEHDDNVGYLSAVLNALDISVDSQVLVFSKSSLQQAHISPETPRAVYFNDEVYVGFSRDGDFVEVSVADAEIGTAFYTLDQAESELPMFQRRTESCLICHSSSQAEGVPGQLVRSILVDAEGYPVSSAGSLFVDHTTPIEQRWGGWYVTGTHGEQTHRGNLWVPEDVTIDRLDNSQGLNRTTIGEQVDSSKYLAPHSDIVALMVLEHQVLVHNRIAKAALVTDEVHRIQAEINRSRGQTAATLDGSIPQRIRDAGEELIEALLFVGEAKLTDEMRGTSGFAASFTERGPRDGRERSLRDFDLKNRMFRYPCSYMIYSDAFESLPAEFKTYVWQRLAEILTSTGGPAKFDHLSPEDRQAIIEILKETKDSLPARWPAGSGTNENE